ncbi:MAG: outer membrane protein assembly factor BamD [Rickettsiaceae bacterium]|nr:outer membrane protein assembly factor BamD [Rickettsiaceae bacterium]
MKIIKYSVLFILLTSCVSGCGHKKKQLPEMPAQELYDHGMDAFKEKDYQNSADYFGEVFFQNPSSNIAASSEVMHAFSLYKQGAYDDAIDVIDIFVKLRPHNEYASYMHYLRALCYYVQIESIKLEQSKSEKALQELEFIIQHYPNTEYAQDSKIKKELVLNHLAGKEMEIGRYYLNKKNPIAAIGRFQGVTVNYSNSVHIEEAYYRLVEANLMLGLSAETDYFYQILLNKYPQSNWTTYAKKLLD